MASAALAQECVKHAFIHVHVPLARSEPSKSCQSSDWVDYPGDEDHALRAHAILGLLSDKIQDREQRMGLPSGVPQLTGYKYAIVTNQAYYYFLRIQAREDFLLYVRVFTKGMGADTDHFVLSPREPDIYKAMLKCHCMC